jgi:predicted dinucleotide-binding enzyme
MTTEAVAAEAVTGKAMAGNCRPAGHETAALAEQIGLAALDLAKRANSAGLTALGFLLEIAALEAGAEAAARKWPADAAQNYNFKAPRPR